MPHWRCVENRKHRQPIALSHFKLPKMRQLVPPAKRVRLAKSGRCGKLHLHPCARTNPICLGFSSFTLAGSVGGPSVTLCRESERYGIGACDPENREYTEDVPPDPQRRPCPSAGEVPHRPPVSQRPDSRMRGCAMSSKQGKLIARRPVDEVAQTQPEALGRDLRRREGRRVRARGLKADSDVAAHAPASPSR